MTNLDNLKSLSVDSFAEWLDTYGQHDSSPWSTWFNEHYCSKCEPVTCSADIAREKLGLTPWYGHDVTCGWCELHAKCKFFPDYDGIPSNKDTIKLWLLLECED